MKVIIVILMIAGNMFAQKTPDQVISGSIWGDSLGLYITDKGTKNTQGLLFEQGLNEIYNSTKGMFNIYIDTTSPYIPFVLKSGDTMTGKLTINARLQVSSNIVNVSTSTTSSNYLCLVGAVSELPASGYNEGCMVYNLTDHILYVSTETVVGSYSWKPVW